MLVKDDNGKVLKAYGVYVDLTFRKSLQGVFKGCKCDLDNWFAALRKQLEEIEAEEKHEVYIIYPSGPATFTFEQFKPLLM